MTTFYAQDYEDPSFTVAVPHASTPIFNVPQQQLASRRIARSQSYGIPIQQHPPTMYSTLQYSNQAPLVPSHYSVAPCTQLQVHDMMYYPNIGMTPSQIQALSLAMSKAIISHDSHPSLDQISFHGPVQSKPMHIPGFHPVQPELPIPKLANANIRGTIPHHYSQNSVKVERKTSRINTVHQQQPISKLHVPSGSGRMTSNVQSQDSRFALTTCTETTIVPPKKADVCKQFPDFEALIAQELVPQTQSITNHRHSIQAVDVMPSVKAQNTSRVQVSVPKVAPVFSPIKHNGDPVLLLDANSDMKEDMEMLLSPDTVTLIHNGKWDELPDGVHPFTPSPIKENAFPMIKKGGCNQPQPMILRTAHQGPRRSRSCNLMPTVDIPQLQRMRFLEANNDVNNQMRQQLSLEERMRLHVAKQREIAMRQQALYQQMNARS